MRRRVGGGDGVVVVVAVLVIFACAVPFVVSFALALALPFSFESQLPLPAPPLDRSASSPTAMAPLTSPEPGAWRAKTDRKKPSHLSVAPSVAIDETCMTRLAGSFCGATGTQSKISRKPGQPHAVYLPGFAAASRTREGTDARKAARTGEKS